MVSFSVQIVIEMHLLSVRYVVVRHIALHFVKVKTGTIIKWNVITRKGALCLLFKLKMIHFRLLENNLIYFKIS